MSSCKNRKPSASGSGPVQAFKIKEVKSFARRHSSTSRLGPHLQFIAETVGCLGWVVAGNRPCVFIRENYDNGKRHVREIKEIQPKGDREHSEWIRAWQEVILELEAFVTEFHRNGLVWGSA